MCIRMNECTVRFMRALDLLDYDALYFARPSLFNATTPMTTTSERTFTRWSAVLCMLAVLFMGLVGCAETETPEATEAEEDTAMAETETMASSDSVTVGGTISLLQQGLTSISASAAVSNIEGWQEQLEAAGSEPLMAISNNLEELKGELQNDSIDGAAVGELLVSLGDQTVDAAQNAGGTATAQLTQLGNLLQQAGNQLTGEGM